MSDYYDNILELFPRDFSAEPLLTRELVGQLLSGEDVEDSEFDRIFPSYYQFQSMIHWSSIRVARQIADWIVPLNRKCFVDIGCGVGKLCLLLQILTDYEVFGIEQRPELVEIAKQVIKANNLKKISITQLNMLELNWEPYDIYYLYNPFQEHITSDRLCIIEKDIELDSKNYSHYISEVFRQLSWAKPGKVLITFHGYGGSVPRSWSLKASRRIGSGDLMLWIKE